MFSVEIGAANNEQYQTHSKANERGPQNLGWRFAVVDFRSQPGGEGLRLHADLSNR